MMYAVDGKTDINVRQIVSAHQSKDGETRTLYLTDDKTYVVSKGQYTEIRGMLGEQPAPTPISSPLLFNIQLAGTAEQQ
jgi:hypothetical protein